MARKTKTGKLSSTDVSPVNLPRIIGGTFRGRKLRYGGDARTRPMKDRVREAVFNLLSSDVTGTHAIDLFAGTGALGLEALSRGAVRATLLERHFPTAAIIRENIAALKVEDQAEVIEFDTFFWLRGLLAEPRPRELRWLIFCSPPYDFYVDRAADMLGLITSLWDAAKDRSLFVVESDRRFDCRLLPDQSAWDVREYPPARIAIGRKE